LIKHKPGQAGRDLILKDNPQGVKFALGENVTRRTGRFPNTRMGVEATIERAFEEGRAYKNAWKAYEAAKAHGDAGPPLAATSGSRHSRASSTGRSRSTATATGMMRS